MKTIFYACDERGGGEHGWLSTRYSFSFNTWYDENKMGFGALRVLNDDVIAAGQGFSAHGHRDMEIITIVMRGAVAHEDSLGNAYVVCEGDVQVMSAGTGVRHAEYNHSSDESLELFQIWIEPRVLSVEPKYFQKNYDFKNITNDVIELVGKSSLSLNQEASIFYGAFTQEKSYMYHLRGTDHGVFIFVIEGTLEVGGKTLEKRDALGVRETKSVTITSQRSSAFLIIEVPMSREII